MEHLSKKVEAISLNEPPKVGVFFHRDMLLHKSSKDHPENPQRLAAILDRLEKTDLFPQCKVFSDFGTIPREIVIDFHGENYVEYIENLWEESNTRDTRFYKDTYYNKHTAAVTSLAANALKLATDEVVAGRLDRAFAIVRPPGHHAAACQDRIGGFCYYNSVAIAAKYAVKQLKLKRVVIFDWDVHHGDGTSKFIYNDASILYISLHRYDNGTFYPGKSGDINNLGEGEGLGYNLNYPWNLPHDYYTVGDNEYIYALERIFIPIIREFDPELIFISAGFDAACGDPLGRLDLSPDGYAYMTKRLMDLLPTKFVIGLEGGYNLDSISKASEACLRVLLDQKMPLECSENRLNLEEMEKRCFPNSVGFEIGKQALEIFSQYWPVIKTDPRALEFEKRAKEYLEHHKESSEVFVKQNKFLRKASENFASFYCALEKEQNNSLGTSPNVTVGPLFAKYLGTTKIALENYLMVENLLFMHPAASTLQIKIGRDAKESGFYISAFALRNNKGEVTKEGNSITSTNEIANLLLEFLGSKELGTTKPYDYMKGFMENLEDFATKSSLSKCSSISVMFAHDFSQHLHCGAVTSFAQADSLDVSVKDGLLKGLSKFRDLLNSLNK